MSGNRAQIPKRPTLRVWLPSRWCKPNHLGESLSTPNALGIRSSELSSASMVEEFFRILPTLLPFSTRPFSDLAVGLQRLAPTEEAVPLFPEGLVRGEALALLSFRASRVFPSPCRSREPLPHDITLSLLEAGSFTASFLMSLRAPRQGRFGIFLKGCRPVWRFARLRPRSFRPVSPLGSIFSSQRPPRFATK